MDAIKNLLKSFSQHPGVDSVAVYQLHTDQNSAQLLCHVGESPRESAPFGVGLVGECAKTVKPAVSEFTHPSRPDKFQSQIVYPILDKNSELIGVLHAASRTSVFFKNPNNQSLIKELAQTISREWPSTKHLGPRSV